MRKPNEQTKNKAFYYYSLGLNSKEIAKLLDISFKTVQGYMYKENWKGKLNPTPLKVKIYNLHKKGLSYRQIAEIHNLSKTTIYKYVKEVKTTQINKNT